MPRRANVQSMPELRQLPPLNAQIGIEGLAGGAFTTIASGVEGDRLLVEVPRLGGRPVPTSAGRVVRLHYRRSDVPCIAEGEIQPHDPAHPESFWVRVRSIERMQRRNAVRVPVTLAVDVLLVPPGGGDPEHLTMIMEDLSAGGARVRTAAWQGLGTALAMRLELDGDVVNACGVVVYNYEDDRRSERRWVLGVRFDGLSGADTDRLVKYTFARERELRRRASGLE